MSKTIYPPGFGLRAVPWLDMDAARELIFCATKAYLKKFDHNTSGNKLIESVKESVISLTASSLAKVVNDIQQDIQNTSYPKPYSDIANGAILFIIHRELLRTLVSGECVNNEEQRSLVLILALHRSEVWHIAFELAKLANESQDSDPYFKSLEVLYRFMEQGDGK